MAEPHSAEPFCQFAGVLLAFFVKRNVGSTRMLAGAATKPFRRVESGKGARAHSACRSLLCAPLPVSDFRHVFAMLADVVLMLDELVLKLLLQIGALGTHLRQAVDHVHHQVEAIQIVKHGHVEGGGDRAFFLVAADV